MALMSDDTHYYQLIDCLYKCKRFKTIKSRHFKENHHHILEYRFEQEILVLERVQASQHHSCVFKYKSKRCTCKIKENPAAHGHCSSSNGSTTSENNKKTTNSNNCHFRSKICSSEVCASMIASVWHEAHMSPAVINTTDRFHLPRKRSTLSPTPTEESLSMQTESLTKAAFSTSYLSHFSIIYNSFDRIETGSAFCDIPCNYLNKNVDSKINLITYKKKQSPPQSRNQNFSAQSSSYYLLMMFVTIVKEFVRYVSESLNRMRHKTQFILPILILFQLLTAAPMTNCTNQTITTVAPTFSHSDVISAPIKEAISLVASTATASSATANGGEKNQADTTHHQTGGSSITSYISQEGKIRRDPSSGFSSSGCHSCQMREQVKADNLESIKRHILLRLEMTSLPNITAPLVPRTIIENFYKNYSYLDNNNNNKKSLSIDDASADSKRKNLGYTMLSLSRSNGGHDRTKITDNHMQSDDPNTYPGDYEKDDEKDEQLYKSNFAEEFFSIVNSVYVFPTMPRMRHNRKTEILNFKFKSNEHSTVSQALLHIYIRGRDWMREYEPNLAETTNSINAERREITITINRVVRRVNSTIATHTVNVTESQHKIPDGLGQWISIDVTQLVQGWLRNITTNQGIVIKGSESWMKPFIITGDSPNNKAFTVYIEMLTKDNRKRRTKRNTSMNCSESDNEERCCRYPLEVNFIEFEWTWVVAPTSFNAYFCNGECQLGFLEKYPHTHLMQLSTAPQPCCSPTKMSPLRLLYFNAENTLVMSTIPNMAVEKCSCS